MQEVTTKVEVDSDTIDEVYTDTSMFNAEDIVRNIEEAAREKQAVAAAAEKKLDPKRRLEIMREERLLQENLQDIDDFDVSD